MQRFIAAETNAVGAAGIWSVAASQRGEDQQDQGENARKTSRSYSGTMMIAKAGGTDGTGHGRFSFQGGGNSNPEIE